MAGSARLVSISYYIYQAPSWKSHDILVEVVGCVKAQEAHAMNRFADRKDCWSTCEDL